MILRLGDLCFQRSRKGSSRCAAVSQKEFIKVANNGRNWSSLIGFLLFSLVHLPLMNCRHSKKTGDGVSKEIKVSWFEPNYLRNKKISNHAINVSSVVWLIRKGTSYALMLSVSLETVG